MADEENKEVSQETDPISPEYSSILTIPAANLGLSAARLHEALSSAKLYKEASSLKIALTLGNNSELKRLVQLYEQRLPMMAFRQLQTTLASGAKSLPLLKKVKISEWASVPRSKKEMYTRLDDELSLFLPPYKECPTGFLIELCLGTKKALMKRDIVLVKARTKKCEDLENYLLVAPTNEKFSAYMPEGIIKAIPARGYLLSLLNTLSQGEVSRLLHGCKGKSTKAPMLIEPIIKIRTEIAEILEKTEAVPTGSKRSNLLSDVVKKMSVRRKPEDTVRIKRRSKNPEEAPKPQEHQSKRFKPEPKLQQDPPLIPQVIAKTRSSAEHEADKVAKEVSEGNKCIIISDHGPDVEVSFSATTTTLTSKKPI